MFYSVMADAVVVFHLTFIVFVMLGGLLVLHRRAWALLHLPAVAWGMAVEFLHLYCPLTPLENSLRLQAGAAGYEGDFIDHYLTALIYPAGLTPQIQTVLGSVVVVGNLGIYLWVILRWRGRRNAA
jgi:cytochrome c biogenesis protein CcdA